jgi:septation ring formation regulator EzrA
MTEKIEKNIGEIFEKVKKLHFQLQNEKLKNISFLSEIETMKTELFSSSERESILKNEIETLQSALHLAENKVVEVPIQTLGKHEEEIEELVKEIEYCIEQLKK